MTTTPTPNTPSPLIPDNQLFDVLGEDGFARIVSLFYAKIPADDILGPMYRASPEAATAPDMETHMRGGEQRLRDFLVGRFGGPQRYVQSRGHPRLRLRHMPFTIDVAARHRWVELISTAIDDAHVDADAGRSLKHYLAQVATFLINTDEHDEPNDPNSVRDLPVAPTH